MSKTKEMTREDFIEALGDHWDSDHPGAAVVAAAAVVGPNVRRIAKFTGLPRSVVAKCGRNLRSSGLWQNNKIDRGWIEDGLELSLQGLVAEGLLEAVEG